MIRNGMLIVLYCCADFKVSNKFCAVFWFVLCCTESVYILSCNLFVVMNVIFRYFM